MANKNLFFDYSSNNPIPNLGKLYKAGYRVISLKATEGTSFVWSQHGRLADEWHRLGGSVWHYHFAHPGSARAQADYFLKTCASHVGSNDKLIVDAEFSGVNGKLVTGFLNRCHAKHPNIGLGIYGSAYFLRDHNIRPVHGAILWLAGYPTYSFVPPGWDKVTAHQFTDAAKDPSTGARVDQSRLLTETAKPKPKPKPTPKPKPKVPQPLSLVNRKAADHLVKTLPQRKNPPTAGARAQLVALKNAVDHALNVE